MTSSVLAQEVASRAYAGVALDEIDRVLIQPAPLGEDEKAALWLLAWMYGDGGRQSAPP